MLRSHVIEINGTFVGAAIAYAHGFLFRAVHPRVGGLDGQSWPSLGELRRAAAHLFVTGQIAVALAARPSRESEIKPKPEPEPQPSRRRLRRSGRRFPLGF